MKIGDKLFDKKSLLIITLEYNINWKVNILKNIELHMASAEMQIHCNVQCNNSCPYFIIVA